MKITDITPQEDDSPEFFEQVRNCVGWITCTQKPPELFLIKIDNWFGSNWLGFSGKALGLIGIRSNNVTMKLNVPPFVPHRVVWERRFIGPNYQQKPIKKMVHIDAPSPDPLLRQIGDIAPNASLVWFSGRSLRNGRGALMAYLFDHKSYWIWYTGWIDHSGWKIVKAIGLTPERFKSFSSAVTDP